MYALYLNAVPSEANEGYKEKRAYEIIVIINTLSREYAIEKAQKVLQDNDWKDVNIEQTGIVPEDKRGQHPMDQKDYLIFVFPDSKKETGFQKLVNRAKSLINKRM